MEHLIFKLITLLGCLGYIDQISASGTPSKFCYLPLPQFWKMEDGGLNMEGLYFQYPFLRPLPAPVCPNENDRHNCTYGNDRYRTADGTCNNLLYPWWGARLSPYQRLLHPTYTVRNDEFVPRLSTKQNNPLPEPRRVSNRLPTAFTLNGLNSWFTFFGQLVGHDLAHTASTAYSDCKCGSEDPECFNIRIIEPNEQEIPTCFESSYTSQCRMSQDCIPFPRSSDAKHSFDCKFESREQYTIGTHFLDLDNLYGATNEQQRLLRTYQSGELKYDKIKKEVGYEEEIVESLPIKNISSCFFYSEQKSKGCIYAGDTRADDFTFTSVSTTLMMRAHNEIARGLKKVNSNWSDEVTFQEARRILIALYQNIVYSEYLEILLGKDTMAEFGLNPLENGWSMNYNKNLYPNNYNEFITAAFRLHQTVHTDITLLDEELESITIAIGASSYSLIQIHRFALNNWLYYDQLNTLMFSFLGEATYNARFGMSSSLNHLLPLNTDNTNNERTSLAAMNVQRGRDHGLATYGDYRHMVGGRYPADWDDADVIDLFGPATIASLRDLYHSPADLDLWIGLLAEKADPEQLLAETQRWLVGKNFFMQKYGDRFYYENGHDEVNRFSEDQLETIREFRFSSLLCLGFQDITEEQEIPEYGFFMHEEFGPPSSSCEYVTRPRPTNELKNCDELPKLDFNAWDSTSYYLKNYY